MSVPSRSPQPNHPCHTFPHHRQKSIAMPVPHQPPQNYPTTLHFLTTKNAKEMQEKEIYATFTI